MKHKVHTFSSTLAAVIAIGALGASNASAAEFHAGFPVTGQQATVNVLATQAGTVSCKTNHFNGTLGLTSSQITLIPSYGENTCTAFGFIGVQIDVNGCAFLITADGVTHIECPVGAALEITVPGCTTKIGPQTVSTTTFANNAEKADITVTFNISGLTYTECGQPPKSNGTYKGTTTLTSPANIWFE